MLITRPRRTCFFESILVGPIDSHCHCSAYDDICVDQVRDGRESNCMIELKK